MLANPRARLPVLLIAASVVFTPTVAMAQPGEAPAPPAGERQRGDRAERRERQYRDGVPGGMNGLGGGLIGLLGGMGGPGGLGGGRVAGEPSISDQDINRYADSLKLSPDQRSAVDALHTAFEENYRVEAEKVRQKMQDLRDRMRESRDPAVFTEFADRIAGTRAKRTELENAFFADIKAVLTPEQAQQWPRFEQARRREQGVQRGVMSGERLDLVEITSELTLDEKARAELTPVLDQYQDDLDRQLVERQRVQDEVADRFRQLLAAQDYDAMQKLFEQARASATKVRDVNQRYARQLSALLPEATRSEFDQTVQRRSFPTIYRPTYGARAIAAIEKFEDLSAEQKTALESIKAAHTQQASGINARIEQMTAQRETAWSPIEAMRAEGGQGFGQMRAAMRSFITDDMRQAIQQRTDLEATTLSKLEAMLTAEQKARLPEREGRGFGEDVGGPRGEDRQGETPRRQRQRPAADRPGNPNS